MLEGKAAPVASGANVLDMFGFPASLSAMIVLSGAPRGRGAQSNATGRFESQTHEAFDDGWTEADEAPAHFLQPPEWPRSMVRAGGRCEAGVRVAVALLPLRRVRFLTSRIGLQAPRS
jgi:hypothetical protein